MNDLTTTIDRKKRPPCPVHGCEFAAKDGRFGRFYGCPRWPDCDRIASKSKFDMNWRVSDQETRTARIAAHDAFDAVWKSGRATRSRCYHALGELLGLSSQKCHIEHFDVERCDHVVWLAESGAIERCIAAHLAGTNK